MIQMDLVMDEDVKVDVDDEIERVQTQETENDLAIRMDQNDNLMTKISPSFSAKITKVKCIHFRLVAIDRMNGC